MCGIIGLTNFESSLEPDVIRAMTETLRHRGPDDEGYLAADLKQDRLQVTALSGPDSMKKDSPLLSEFTGRASLFLGHRRLAILDTSAAGHQPMAYGSDLWIVFNGEVYNFVELRQELKSDGYEFNTRTDTEVILAAYKKWGKECITHFNGDWAFCILDTRRQIVFLSRDRYGIKPLYFFRTNKHFGFASEIKALLSLSLFPRSLNRGKAFDYCAFHDRDHTKETLFDSVYQLRPGQNMSVDLRTGKTMEWYYYSLSYCPDLGEYSHQKALAYASNVRDLLLDAVRIRLRADVPVGACLSGGLDSSSIVAMMGKLQGLENTSKTQHTFTASFPGESFDETRFAKLVANKAAARSHFVYPSEDGYFRQLPAILYHQEEPFGSPNIYSHWVVMNEASKHVKVVLDGQGGDEVFGGYWHSRVSFLAHLFTERRIRSLVSEMCWTIARAGGVKKAIEAIQPFPFYVLGKSFKRRLYCRLHRDRLKMAEENYGSNGQASIEHIDRKFSSNTNEQLFHYMTVCPLPYLLKSEDRNGMAHSIEARVPFTDYRLVDYVFSLPAVYKIRHGWTKWLLRLAVKDLLPQEIVWRKEKLGFTTPSFATRKDEWKTWMERNFRDV